MVLNVFLKYFWNSKKLPIFHGIRNDSIIKILMLSKLLSDNAFILLLIVKKKNSNG